MPISYADATSGRYVFTNNGNSGSVVNQGRITALNGYVGLFAPKVINEGVIVARMGRWRSPPATRSRSTWSATA